MRWHTLICLLFVVGCSSEPAEADTDVSVADVGSVDVAPSDASSPAVDAGSDVTFPSDQGRDAASASDIGADLSVMPDLEVMPDMSDPFAGRPTGQCTQNTDCPVGPNGQMCSRGLPGGACLGCGNDTHCPGTASCSMFGACITDCGDDADCPPGLECLGSGRCAAISCVDTCPVALFACVNGQCAREDCSADPGVCPDQTTCADGVCVEDRALMP